MYNDSIFRVGDSYSGIFCTGIYEDENKNIFISSLPSNKTHKIDNNNDVTLIDSVLLGINLSNKKIWLNHQVVLDKRYHIFKQKFVGDYAIFYCLDKQIKENILITINTQTNERQQLNISNLTTNLIHFDEYQKNKITLSTKEKIYILNLASNQLTSFLEDYSSIFNNPALIYTDNNQNCWIPDLKQGLIFMQHLPKNASYKSFNMKNEEIVRVSQKQNKNIIITTNLSKTMQLSIDTVVDDTINKFKDLKINFGNTSNTAISIEGTRVLIKNKGNANLIIALKSSYTSLLNRAIYSLDIGDYKCHFWEQDMLYIGTNNGAYSIDLKNDSIKIEKWIDGYVSSLNATEKLIYAGTENGLYQINKKTKEVKTLYAGNSVKDIVLIKENIIARIINGIILKINLQKKGEIKEYHHLKNISRIKKIDGELWAINHNKMFLINIDDEFSRSFELNDQNGFNNPNKIDLNRIEDDYFLICNNGFYTFKKKNVFNKTSKNQYFGIRKILVDNFLINNLSQINLNDNENFIKIQMEAFNYPFANKLVYLYKYGKGNWNQSSNPEINILNAPYGSYEILIKAQFKEGTPYGTLLKIAIENPSPFYVRSWFIILILLVTFFSLFLFFKIKNEKKVQFSRIKFKLIQNRQKMLTMQMKPHFLSNIFNNLQGAILNDDLEKSSNLIKEVDQYLRQTIKLSENDYNTLEQEIVSVKRYIDIEQGRISKALTFVLAKNWSDYKTKIVVPVFILQPIIENAIWHGIQKSNHLTGIIKLELDEIENYYIISIQDNGIGLNAKLNDKGHAIALKNIEERLSLIDTRKRKKYINIISSNDGVTVKLYVTKKTKHHSH